MSRSRWDMPKDVDEELHSSGLEAAYQARPPYQRNDYISWINQAKQESTREKRIKQMLEELKQGDVYMKMPWKSGAKADKKAKPTTLDEFISQSGSLFEDEIRKIDSVLMKVEPGFETKSAWSGWAYKAGDNYSSMIVRYKDHLKLMVWRGIYLNDPKGVFEGSGSNTRHIKYKSIEDIDEEYLTRLISEQLEKYAQGMSYED